jgi:glycosyltransferase involved in cell wall biosynthesis
MKDNHHLVDFEFTLALNNATGKYFLCRDVIEECGDLIDRVWYWRLPMKQLPTRTMAKVLGRLAVLEISFRLKSRASTHLPLMHNPRPLLLGDPREVILYELKPRDVVLCHDMGPVTHPDLYQAKPLLVFVSECSLKTFVTLYGDDYTSMKLHPALRMGIHSGPEEPIAAAPQRFLLTVGSVGSRKNHVRSLEAFALSGLAELGYHYVICGGPEPGFDAVVESAGKIPAVVLPGYVSDNELRWLYAHASGFVLPSLLEGFGLPAAEAIARDLLPLVSRGGALHEVAGDSAILVDPLNANEIAVGMRRHALMGEQERQSRPVGLRRSIARFSRESAVEAWRAKLHQALAT